MIAAPAPPAARTVTLPTPSRWEVAGRVGLALRLAVRHRRAGRVGIVRRTFDDLGGTFVKFGQLIASAPSIFGDDVSAEFRGSLDAGAPVPFAQVRTVIESELGHPLTQLFGSFEPTPMAAASLAVVHRATLPDGTPVAVKVLRPGIEHRIAADLAVLGPLCNFIARQVAVGVAGTLNGLVEGLRTQLAEELDLRNEADAARWFAGVVATIGHREIVVPAAVPDMVTRRTLVMSMLDGVPIDDAVGIAALGVDPVPLLRSCLRAWFTATLASGAFHGDIHAGNILVRADSTIALLDWGIVGRLDGDTAVFFRRMLEGAMGDDAAWLDVGAHLERSYGSDIRLLAGAVDDASFAAWVRAQIEPVLTTPFGAVDLRAMLIDDGRPTDDRSRRGVVRNWWQERRRQQAMMDSAGYGGDFDRAQFLLAKQLVYFERYGKQYLPDVPLLDDPAAFRALLA